MPKNKPYRPPIIREPLPRSFKDLTPAKHFNPRTLYALSRFTRFVNFLGLPALAVPAGFDASGLPVGLQVVGAPGSEALLLEIGSRLQAGSNWHSRVPRAIAGDISAEAGSPA